MYYNYSPILGCGLYREGGQWTKVWRCHHFLCEEGGHENLLRNPFFFVNLFRQGRVCL